jgi:hypothetical protein
VLAVGAGGVVGRGAVWVIEVGTTAVKAAGVGRAGGVGSVGDVGVEAASGAVTLVVAGDTDAGVGGLRLSPIFGVKAVVKEYFSGFFATCLSPGADVSPTVAGAVADDADAGELFAPAELSPVLPGWSAHATPPPESTAAPIPNAAANPPIRPMLPAAPMPIFLPPRRGGRKSSEQGIPSRACVRANPAAHAGLCIMFGLDPSVRVDIVNPC